jgi:hypothetical protein
MASAHLLTLHRSHGHRNVPLEPAKGMLILDVVDGVIAQVEILYRNDIRQNLLAVPP